ncbi:hypothetical protein AGDE_16354 [Angomonas deanei]|uniref:Uncharacterized protein n=1 Tax=Angomonas deanei TaxID=59799 RepID=A0A7G2BZF0_9TRYP|nr:hypothetical protein AGDE_16354 [Angomonas deanei]CAD2212919.1 hypothetical protein, conserved [Angomonas deanei]|eukprot:EPY17244.1 hypothetical protein AGDE_16354 [Angomonas deanei]
MAQARPPQPEKETTDSDLPPLYAYEEEPSDAAPSDNNNNHNVIVPFDAHLDATNRKEEEEEAEKQADTLFLTSLIARVENFENSLLEMLEHYKSDARGNVELLKRQLYGKLSDMGENQRAELLEMKVKLNKQLAPQDGDESSLQDGRMSEAEKEEAALRKELFQLVQSGMQQVRQLMQPEEDRKEDKEKESIFGFDKKEKELNDAESNQLFLQEAKKRLESLGW